MTVIPTIIPTVIPTVIPTSFGLGLQARLRYRAGTQVLGTPPAVESAPNVAAPGFADVAEATNQPDLTTVLGAPAWTFTSGELLTSSTESSPSIAETGDYACLLIAAKSDAVGNGILTDVGVSGASHSGLSLMIFSSAMYANARVVGGGLQQISTSFTDTTSRHVFQARVSPAGVTVGIDGVLTTGGSANAGLLNTIDTARLANMLNGSLPIVASISEVIYLRNPSDADVNNAQSYLMSLYT